MELEEETRKKEDEECVFCAIAAHRHHADVIFEDSPTMAFMDINPASVGHSLVIPKSHFRNIYDIDEMHLLAVMKTVRRIACATRKGLKTHGTNILQNNEEVGFQAVFHFHVHIIPRWLNDGYSKIWRNKPGDRDIIRKTAFRIKREL